MPFVSYWDTDKDVDKEGAYKKCLLVRQEGKRRVRRDYNAKLGSFLPCGVVVRNFRTTASCSSSLSAKMFVRCSLMFLPKSATPCKKELRLGQIAPIQMGLFPKRSYRVDYKSLFIICQALILVLEENSTDNRYQNNRTCYNYCIHLLSFFNSSAKSHQLI